ncbi:MAG: hypothetical protein LBO82_10465 [Synergistaceae bacterium]|jgi:hypothetical protein|nr:hypothetical protein [Synergistaceae bacterium]
MSMKGFKKALLVLTAVISSVSAAWGAPSALVGGGEQKSDASLEREIEGGIKVTLQGAYHQDKSVGVKYVVLSEKDVIVKIEAENDNGALFDNHGNQFTSHNYETRIGNNRTQEREIIGGVPTEIFVLYQVGEKYAMPEKFARVSVNVNGKKLTFRGVPSKQ